MGVGGEVAAAKVGQLFFGSNSFSFSTRDVSVVFIFLVIHMLGAPAAGGLAAGGVAIDGAISKGGIRRVSWNSPWTMEDVTMVG